MIDVILSARCVRKLKRELKNAGQNEIGGVMAAEQIADGQFVVRDLSVQRNGTPTSFVRDPLQHRKFMRRFRMLTGNNHERFNYLGEWHSHPSFLALPSPPDVWSMQEEMHDPEQASSFLVLLILKLGRSGRLVGSTHAFRRAQAPIRVRLGASDGVSVQEEEGFRATGPWRSLQHDQGAVTSAKTLSQRILRRLL